LVAQSHRAWLEAEDIALALDHGRGGNMPPSARAHSSARAV
jgi:hypothetical protein